MVMVNVSRLLRKAFLMVLLMESPVLNAVHRTAKAEFHDVGRITRRAPSWREG